MTRLALVVLAVALRTYTMHLPTKLEGHGASLAIGDSTAHSWMHFELWYWPADSVHRVPSLPWWPLFDHRIYIASSRDSSPDRAIHVAMTVGSVGSSTARAATIAA